MVDVEKDAGSVWDWTPLVSAGPIRFGQHIAELPDSLRLVCERRRVDADGEWVWYTVEGTDYSLLAENGNVTSVSCTDLQYGGQTLAGLTVWELNEIFGAENVCRGLYPSDTTLEVGSLDCMLTLDEETQRVSAISVGGGKEA